MKKLIVMSMMSLDGVMQAPGGPKEDTSGGFEFGGWSAPFGDEAYGKAVQEKLKPADLLLGRKTFDIWETYWPMHGDFWPAINPAKKYVFSNTRTQSGWQNSFFIKDVEAIKALKADDGLDINVWGSTELIQLLLKHDLVDVLRLKIHPLLLGKGKKIFGDDAFPRAFTLTESITTTKGVILATYERAGDVEVGEAGSK